MAHPQSGKSMAVTDFIAWVAGRNPNVKTIFASYSDTLGERTLLDLQRILNSDNYIKIFGRTRIGLQGWKLTTNLIEFSDFGGSFRYTTSLGAVTGLELHLGVIDDPVKGRQEAFSKTIRDRTWSWFTDDFSTRFNRDAGLLCIMTRWHVDDLLGRLIAKHPDMTVLRYPAIAEEDSEFRKAGQVIRELVDMLPEERKNSSPRVKELEAGIQPRLLASQTVHLRNISPASEDLFFAATPQVGSLRQMDMEWDVSSSSLQSQG
jgi:hypothetical protein